jgi:hypothetical protein
MRISPRELFRWVGKKLPDTGGAGGLLAEAERQMRVLRADPNSKIAGVLAGMEELLLADDGLGRIYQAINAPALEKAYRATARERRKFTAEEIPAVTQLFTPNWVVKFLLHNTLGSLWRGMHPDSKLRWQYLVDQKHSAEDRRRAIDLRVCDPACGTMNFGLVAIEMLREMYREEIERAGTPGWPSASCSRESEIDQTIVAHNLYGFDIDPVALELGGKTLEIKIGEPVARHHLSLADALFDVDEQFDVVVTNPPYLSARNLNPQIVQQLKTKFPTAWRDFYACFLLKSLQLLRPGGLSGILCMHSFMFTGAFEKLRREMGKLSSVRTAAHFGPGLFEIGNPGTLQTVAVVLQKKPATEEPAVFFRLVDAQDKQTGLRDAIGEDGIEISQAQLFSFPRAAWMYWLAEDQQKIFKHFPTLGEIASPKQGLATTDNSRFVRYWWEVESPGFSGERKKWFSYAKGGGFCRWFQSPRHRVDWENDGREIKRAIVERYPYLQGKWGWVAKNSEWYGKPGITYSYLTSGRFSARQLEAGTFFDVAGSALFPADPLPILGILNSATAHKILSAINPTVNFQVGDLRLLPVPKSLGEDLHADVQSAIDLAKQLDQFDETSPIFQHPAPWESADEIPKKLAEIERRIDRTAARLYGLETENHSIESMPLDRRDLARRWISYAFGAGAHADEVVEILKKQLGPGPLAEIEKIVGGIEHFLSNEFLPWHGRLYRGRPLLWGFSNGGKTAIIHWRDADSQKLGEVLAGIEIDLPPGWQRRPDDGIIANLMPLADYLVDRQLKKKLRITPESIGESVLPRHPPSFPARSAPPQIQ